MRTKSQSVQSDISSNSFMAASNMVSRLAPPQMVENLVFITLKLGNLVLSLDTSLNMYSCLNH